MSKEALGNIIATAIFATVADAAGWHMWAAMLGWSVGSVLSFLGGVALRRAIANAEREGTQ